eukprot:CAMPEP_0113670558 /NCGR_PEP_ID=MMETSP0038_2-20120614/5205_1 /TAXON_ID=2898 /ORGANISM="Cryptomonas paramecium" /LENGTH=203 /DNA_ID=CAMNT_0000586591 /DNA_START=51 /DNA_END=658 /DNA_ORIENTATION=+ /assembly_acc=CAM_ASM_000170
MHGNPNATTSRTLAPQSHASMDGSFTRHDNSAPRRIAAGAMVETVMRTTAAHNQERRPIPRGGVCKGQSNMSKFPAGVEPGTLLAAVDCGDVDCVRALLDSQAEVNLANQHGVTPLMKAAGYGDACCAETLLRSGANTDVESPSGWTALLLATNYGHADVVHALLSARADPNRATRLACAPLTAAARHRDGTCLRLLLEARAR